MPHGPRCVFGDIQKCIRDSARDTLLANAWRMLPTDMERLVRSGKLVKNTAYCYAHGHSCCYERAHIHVAGTPCPD
eukprot:7338763-Pyramimonas_sp.AAC.1